MEETKQALNHDDNSSNVVQNDLKTFVLKRFMRHYKDLFPLSENRLTPLEKNKAGILFKNKDLSLANFSGKTMTMVNKSSSVKSHFAFLLTKLPYLSEATFLTLSDILDMQFNNHPRYSSIRDVRTPIVLIYIESITNRLKDEYLLKAVEHWCMNGMTVWIYFKGQTPEWTTNFPKTIEFTKSHRFSSADLNQKTADIEKQCERT